MAILKIMGQIAGIAGLSLGVFLLVIRALITKVELTKLTQKASAVWVTKIAILAFAIAVIGMVVWLASSAIDAVGQRVENVTRQRGTAVIRFESPFSTITCSAKPAQNAREKITRLILANSEFRWFKQNPHRMEAADWIELKAGITGQVTEAFYKENYGEPPTDENKSVYEDIHKHVSELVLASLREVAPELVLTEHSTRLLHELSSAPQSSDR